MKILPTIGPKTIQTKNLKYLLNQTDIVRLNASHNSINWHQNAILKIKSIKENTVILIDIPGVKPRTINKEEIKIKKNQIICFSYKLKIPNSIKLSKPLPEGVSKCKKFSVDDGKFFFRKIKSAKNFIYGKAMSNCIIKSMKGLNIPNSIYNNKIQEQNYLKFLKIFSKFKIDAVGLSFVQNKKVINTIKKKFPNIFLVSKIENTEGLKNIEQISNSSDAIMIDRGDLSAEIGDANLYPAINKISQIAKKYGKPLIMATENLETFYKSDNPSRNDIVSLGFSKEIKTDIIMLSEETALSPKWKRIFNWLKNFLKVKENLISQNNDKNIFWEMSRYINGQNIVIFTKKGLMFDKIFKENLDNKVFIFTDTKRTFNLGRYYKNTECYMTEKFNNKNINKFYLKYLKKYKKQIFKKANIAFLITIAFPKKGSAANSISLIEKDKI